MRDNAFLFIKNSFFVSLSSVTTKQCASVFARRARKEAQASKTDAQILWTRGSHALWHSLPCACLLCERVLSKKHERNNNPVPLTTRLLVNNAPSCRQKSRSSS